MLAKRYTLKFITEVMSGIRYQPDPGRKITGRKVFIRLNWIRTGDPSPLKKAGEDVFNGLIITVIDNYRNTDVRIKRMICHGMINNIALVAEQLIPVNLNAHRSQAA